MGYFETIYPQLKLPIAPTGEVGLREAQVAAAHGLSAHFFAKKEPGIVVMPTGSGKTGVMLLVSILLRANRVLVLTPSRMVREQLGENFGSLHFLKRVGALPKDVDLPRVRSVRGRLAKAADWTKLSKKDVVVSTVHSASPYLSGVARPPSDLFDLVMVDEAHHSPAPSWIELLDCFPDARHALFTATPFRRDERRVRGRIVFEYPLARARDDGVFGRLSYEPVRPSRGMDPDLALARATDARFKADKRAGHRHLVMVRTGQRSRAEELAVLYETKTSLRLATVFGSHGQNHVRSVVTKMVDGDLDGVICVDMLGEGFDLPWLKIAALHSPHKSLGVTLQFIGRFARTTEPGTGAATFLAIPSEIETEAEHLYRIGAEWNEIVEEASRKRIEAERESREILESFLSADPSGNQITAGEELDLADISPRFHVKVFSIPGGVNLRQEFPLPSQGLPILVRRSAEHNAFVGVTKHVAPCRWSKDERIADISFDLFILYYDELSKLFFICSTRRELAAYDAIVEAVQVGSSRRLSLAELNRVLRGISDPQFFSIGMRKRVGHDESYRMISGPSADRAIQKADGRFFDRGHCYGKGLENGHNTTIGFSTASKVWANEGGGIPAFFRWCRRIGNKLVDAREVVTGSGLDHLPLPTQVSEFPKHIIAVDWHKAFYGLSDFAIRFPLGSGTRTVDISVHELDLRIDACSSSELTFSILGPQVIPIVYRLGTGLSNFTVEGAYTSTTCVDPDGDEVSLAEALNEWPPAFYTAELARLQGDELSGKPPVAKFDTDTIELVDWSTEDVDPLLEKPDGSGRTSLFDWLTARLKREGAPVIVNDDGPGEAADLVTLARQGDRATQVAFYHCKAAKSAPVPGKRVKDVYEVVGQAIKSGKLTLPGVLRRHLLVRTTGKNLKKRLISGAIDDIEQLLKDGIPTVFRMVIVQPGIGAKPTIEQDAILAAAHAYLSGANITGLTIIGTREASPEVTESS